MAPPGIVVGEIALAFAGSPSGPIPTMTEYLEPLALPEDRNDAIQALVDVTDESEMGTASIVDVSESAADTVGHRQCLGSAPDSTPHGPRMPHPAGMPP